jgi:integral membrane protein (TIGR01906 family)
MTRIARILVPALFPLVLTLLWLCVLLSPLFIQLEYRRPGFPADPYGFTLEDRLRWADVSRVYLLSAEGPEYFDPFELAGGTPLYNEREKAHMADVQNLVGKAMILLAVCAPLFAAGCALLLWRDRRALRRALLHGVFFTFGIAAAVALIGLLAWNSLFVTFHRMFFSGDTWLFPLDNTLIRLFPVEFWQDAVITAVGGCLLTCLLILAAIRLGRDRGVKAGGSHDAA